MGKALSERGREVRMPETEGTGMWVGGEIDRNLRPGPHSSWTYSEQ